MCFYWIVRYKSTKQNFIFRSTNYDKGNGNRQINDCTLWKNSKVPLKVRQIRCWPACLLAAIPSIKYRILFFFYFILFCIAVWKGTSALRLLLRRFPFVVCRSTLPSSLTLFFLFSSSLTLSAPLIFCLFVHFFFVFGRRLCIFFA
jgi:hypothetical protein